MNPLHQFYTDIHTREAVKAFMLSQLQEMAVDAVFAKEDISGIYEAKELVEKSFSRLRELYEPKQKPVIDSPR